MKIQYPTNVKRFVASARKNLKQNGSVYSASEKTQKEIEWCKLPYYVRSAVESEMRDLPETKAREKDLYESLGFRAYARSTAKHDGLEILFSGSHNFKSRAALLEWADKLGLEVPTKCEKQGVIVGNEIHTKVSHEITYDDVELEVTYVREGSPTPHCKVETYTETRVTCSLD